MLENSACQQKCFARRLTGLTACKEDFDEPTSVAGMVHCVHHLRH
jgi:hypothetical protein